MGNRSRRKVTTNISPEAAPADVAETEMAEESSDMKLKMKGASNSNSRGFLLAGGELDWRNVTPTSDSLSLLVGSEEGGFLSLEEVDGEQWDLPGVQSADESDFGLDLNAKNKLPTKSSKNKKRKKKGDFVAASVDNLDEQPSEIFDAMPVKKRKKGKADKTKDPASVSYEVHSADGDSKVYNVSVSGKSVTQNVPKKGKKPKLGSKARKLLRGNPSGENGQQNTCIAAHLSSHDQDCGKTSTCSKEDDEMDMSAWAEMRLHPKLAKAIQELKFKEPTPIQRQCIPAAAHKGKICSGQFSQQVLPL